MDPRIVIMNFTHIYEVGEILKNKRIEWIDCTQINGTNCLCDEQAKQQLMAKMSPYGACGIHFIDSGNYHYVSKLWIDKIKIPFSLVVFDHHPDMQPGLFDNLLSCGCWVKEVLDTNPYVRQVCIIGASESLIDRVSSHCYGDRLVFYSDRTLLREEGWHRFAHERLEGPVYISVDKDVLDETYAVTNWDQGTMSLPELKELLTIILNHQRLIGIDICGECTLDGKLFEAGCYRHLNFCTDKEIVTLIEHHSC